MLRTRSGKWLLHPLSGLLLCALLAFLFLAYPIYVIRPFRYQGPDELMLALAVLRFRLLLEILLAGVAIWLVFLAWPLSTRFWYRMAAVVCGLVVLVSVALSRINVYELMFHPLDRISVSPASQTKLDSEEEVIAVRVGAFARAYPVRSMSYHHIVNDIVAGEPIVTTY